MTLNIAILDILKYICNGGIGASYLSSSIRGTWTIVDGDIALRGNFEQGDWIVLLDDNLRLSNIYKLDAPDTSSETPLFSLQNGTDEVSPIKGERTVTGSIRRLVLPVGFEGLAKDYIEWTSNPDNVPSAIKQHSLGQFYSETLATDANGKPLTWFDLNRRKLPPFVMFYEVSL